MAEKFTFYESFYEATKFLDDDDRLEFYDAIMHYVFEGEEPVFVNPLISMGWILVKPNIDASTRGQANGAKRQKGDTAERKQQESAPCEVPQQGVSEGLNRGSIETPQKGVSETSQRGSFETSQGGLSEVAEGVSEVPLDIEVDIEKEKERRENPSKFSLSSPSNKGRKNGENEKDPPICRKCGTKRELVDGRWKCPACGTSYKIA